MIIPAKNIFIPRNMWNDSVGSRLLLEPIHTSMIK